MEFTERFDLLSNALIDCFVFNNKRQVTIITLIHRAFPRIALIGSQTLAFILSFFRNVVNKSNQIDSLKNARDDP